MLGSLVVPFAVTAGSALAQGYPSPVALAPDAERAERVAKLVGQMTLEEKVGQMQNHAAAIPRLGIPAYDYLNEGLHGGAQDACRGSRLSGFRRTLKGKRCR